jgi:hypothetical protein
MQNNPFQIGGPVAPEDYIMPDKATVERVKRNISNHIATAIVSDPRLGKTSLLRYLLSPSALRDINSFGREWKHFVQFIDVHRLLDSNKDRFWRSALMGFGKYIENAKQSDVWTAFKICQESNYDDFDLENLFTIMAENGMRLVLLIDEFDALLRHPFLGSNAFWGNLRSLVTNCDGIGVVITSRLSVNDLNLQTQSVHSATGSPYFNHFNEIVLGLFSREAANSLLDRAGSQFTPIDKKFLLSIAGYHPYFLQLAAHTLWELHQSNPYNRQINYSTVWDTLRRQAPIALSNTWEYWPLRTKQVAAIIALEDMPRSLGYNFDTLALKEDLQVYKQELEFLESRGYIIHTSKANYIISSQILSAWFSIILTQSIQEKDELGDWLLREHRDGILKTKQREQVRKVIAALSKFTEENRDIFLKVIIDTLLKK